VWRVRAAALLFGLFALLQLSSIRTASAWNLTGHRWIALDALTVLPAPMKEALTPHASALLAGLLEPDFNRVVSHKIPIVSLRGTPPPPRSEAPDAFKRFAADAEEMMRLGRGLDEVAFVLGQATHFVQDLNQPLHGAWGETRAEHHEVEDQMLSRSWRNDHTYRGFVLVKDYSCFAYSIAEKSSRHARTLFFDRQIERVTDIAWDQAVNDTASFWQSVFWRALGPERAWQLFGIPAPVGEVGNRLTSETICPSVSATIGR
jgi:zinc dependent phospholipase C